MPRQSSEVDIDKFEEVTVIEGENGTMHVSTPKGAEQELIDDKFRGIVENIGNVATREDVGEPEEPAERPGADKLAALEQKTNRPRSSNRPSKNKK